MLISGSDLNLEKKCSLFVDGEPPEVSGFSDPELTLLEAHSFMVLCIYIYMIILVATRYSGS